MSTPPFLALPTGIRATRVPAAHGELAALAGEPDGTAGRSPVMLVPGFTGSKEDFIGVLAPLTAAGHRVVALDQRGQFESPGNGDPTSYDIKALADDVLAVARDLGEPVHLVGHSFGGLVSRAVALAEPGALRSLTLMDSGPAAIPEPSASNLGLIVAALPVMDLESIWGAKRQLERPHEKVAPEPDVEEWMHRRFLANDPVSLLRMAQQLVGEEDRVDELSAVDLPMLVLFGASDDAWPPAQQADMARRLSAEVSVIDGAGHSPAADEPDATAARLLDFFARC